MARLSSMLAFVRLRFVRRYVIPALLVGFLAAVAVAAYVGGWRAGAIASVFSVIASDVYFLPPTWASAAQHGVLARNHAQVTCLLSDG
jgi:K+-sensing histidine kinase KdpD